MPWSRPREGATSRTRTWPVVRGRYSDLSLFHPLTSCQWPHWPSTPGSPGDVVSRSQASKVRAEQRVGWGVTCRVTISGTWRQSFLKNFIYCWLEHLTGGPSKRRPFFSPILGHISSVCQDSVTGYGTCLPTCKCSSGPPADRMETLWSSLTAPRFTPRRQQRARVCLPPEGPWGLAAGRTGDAALRPGQHPSGQWPDVSSEKPQVFRMPQRQP